MSHLLPSSFVPTPRHSPRKRHTSSLHPGLGKRLLQMTLMATVTSGLAAVVGQRPAQARGKWGGWCEFHADGQNQGFVPEHTYVGPWVSSWVTTLVGPFETNSRRF